MTKRLKMFVKIKWCKEVTLYTIQKLKKNDRKTTPCFLLRYFNNIKSDLLG